VPHHGKPKWRHYFAQDTLFRLMLASERKNPQSFNQFSFSQHFQVKFDGSFTDASQLLIAMSDARRHFEIKMKRL